MIFKDLLAKIDCK